VICCAAARLGIPAWAGKLARSFHLMMVFASTITRLMMVLAS
jgi:hypothetical protein